MLMTDTVSFSAAFIAGLLTFFSPCVFPLIPAYLTFITGFSLEELTDTGNSQIRSKVILSTIAYVLGFSFIFILLGASASFIGGLITRYSMVIRIVGGILIIILGIHLTGLIPIRSLYYEKRVHLQKKPLHFFGTFIIGMAFAAGWSPCIGPLLGSILILAGNQETVGQGMVLLAIYSAGLAIPFMIMSVFVHYFLNLLKKGTRMLKYFNATAGILLIIVGLFLVSNKLIMLQ